MMLDGKQLSLFVSGLRRNDQSELTFSQLTFTLK